MYSSRVLFVYYLKDEVKISPNYFECAFVVTPRCPDRIYFWSVGLGGECYHPSAGIRIGKTGIKKLALQVVFSYSSFIANLIQCTYTVVGGMPR